MFVDKVEIGMYSPFFVIAGPCVLEGKKEALSIAEELVKIQHQTDTKVIFKASYDKANRSNYSSYRGPGVIQGLSILKEIKQETGLPITTDVSDVRHMNLAADIVDMIQIPAFLCRQTDLIKAAVGTGLPVNVKKGQFMSPSYLAAWKIRQFGSTKFSFTERGHCFGYGHLINDMTAIPQMQALGVPVIFDATHSTQISGEQEQTLGNTKDSPVLARAAIAAGANGLFAEVHPSPTEAKCDKTNMLYLRELSDLIVDCKNIFNVVKRNQYGT